MGLALEEVNPCRSLTNGANPATRSRRLEGQRRAILSSRGDVHLDWSHSPHHRELRPDLGCRFRLGRRILNPGQSIGIARCTHRTLLHRPIHDHFTARLQYSDLPAGSQHCFLNLPRFGGHPRRGEYAQKESTWESERDGSLHLNTRPRWSRWSRTAAKASASCQGIWGWRTRG